MIFTEFFNLNLNSLFSPARDDNPPNGPSGIGRAAIENDTSRSLLWSLSESFILSSSNVSITGGGCINYVTLEIIWSNNNINSHQDL